MTEIRKVLIANRGEIAVRIIQAAREMDIATVAVYADPDAEALHVRLADEAYVLPGSLPAHTYLRQDLLLQIAAVSGADAVHPGYGFLSESASFARAVLESELSCVGRDPHTIELLGDKARARALAESVGAPLAPGTNTPMASVAQVLDFVDQHGLPVAIKAVYGGGGRGMRVARTRREVPEAFAAAAREAEAAFGNGDLLVEKFLEGPRHLEAQVLGDRSGRIAVLGTRDCSLQRRSQKLVEEAPAPALAPELHERIVTAAHALCRAASYVGAGTVEFLLGNDGTLSFLEVNTRLQVEHTVTEMVTGIDLVHEQFRIASGAQMDVPEQIPCVGHAFEFRINAEDPALGFLPAPGLITGFVAPTGPGVRLDTGVTRGSVVSGSFDSLLAKLVVWGRDRESALARARRTLDELRVEGPATVLPFHRQLVRHPAFTDLTGGFAIHTRWIEEDCTASFVPADAVAVPTDPHVERTYLEIEGRRVHIGIPESLLQRLAGIAADATDSAKGTTTAPARGASEPPLTTAGNAATENGDGTGAEPHASTGVVLSPFAGTLSAWKKPEGAVVVKGDTVAIIEAMKMEVPILAPVAGTLEYHAVVGAAVGAGQLIGRIYPARGGIIAEPESAT